jgi:tRNA (guanine37-N1)-methyltransferase
MRVPDVLVSGDHGEVERWRRDAALEKTRRNRPDLLKG